MNRKNVMTLVMLTAFGTSAFAVGFLGSPTAEIGQGKWSIGYDYSYSSQDTDKVTADSSLGEFKFKFKDFNLNRHYVTLGYGVADNWDIYVNLGVADLKVVGVDADAAFEWDINFDNDFAWGWGTRYTFAKQDNIAWGAAIQMNWLNTKSSFVRPDTPAPGVTRRGVYDFDSYDLLISAGPTMNFNGWKIYGGPFYYYLNGDYKLKTRDDGVLVYTEKADVKADRNWGAFIGSIINLGQNIDWTVEYATTGKGWGLGTGIAWTF